MDSQEVRQTLQQLRAYFRRQQTEKEEIRARILQDERSKNWNEQIIEQQVSVKKSPTSKEVMMDLIDKLNKIDHRL